VIVLLGIVVVLGLCIGGILLSVWRFPDEEDD